MGAELGAEVTELVEREYFQLMIEEDSQRAVPNPVRAIKELSGKDSLDFDENTIAETIASLTEQRRAIIAMLLGLEGEYEWLVEPGSVADPMTFSRKEDPHHKILLPQLDLARVSQGEATRSSLVRWGFDLKDILDSMDEADEIAKVLPADFPQFFRTDVRLQGGVRWNSVHPIDQRITKAVSGKEGRVHMGPIERRTDKSIGITTPFADENSTVQVAWKCHEFEQNNRRRQGGSVMGIAHNLLVNLPGNMKKRDLPGSPVVKKSELELRRMVLEPASHAPNIATVARWFRLSPGQVKQVFHDFLQLMDAFRVAA